MLDVPTLIAINIILIFVAVMINIVVLKWNPEVPGVRYWVVGNLINASGLLLIFSRTTIPSLYSIVLANTLIVIGFYILYLGFRAHRGKKAADMATIIPLLLLVFLFAAAFAYLTYGWRDLALRVALVSWVTAFLCFVIAIEVAGIPSRDRFLTRGFAVLIAFNGVLNLTRSVATLVIPPSKAFFEGGGMATLAFIESSVAIFIFTVGYILLISDHLLGQLRQQAEIDFLTNVFNSRSFIKLVEKALATARRDQTTLSLVSIDLDRFKKVNDTYGHAAGDAVLRHFSATVTESLRPGDILGRMGGEEFMVLLPDTEMSEASGVAERLRRNVEQSVVQFEAIRVALTISLGVANAPHGEKSFDLLAKESDIALYKAKRAGRNRVAFFEEGDDGELTTGWSGQTNPTL